MGTFDSIFGASDPSKDAMNYLNQIPGTIKPYYDPYITAGQGALTDLQKQYQSLTGMGPTVQNQYLKLIQDPTAMMNQIGSGYTASPGYQYQVDQATQQANKAAAAGGMLGSPSEQQYVANTTNQLANQDYYNYLNHALSQYNTGLSGATGLYNTGLGIESDINHMGYNASDTLAQSLANNLASQANLSYAGAANQNAAKSGLWGGLTGMGTAAMFAPSSAPWWMAGFAV